MFSDSNVVISDGLCQTFQKIMLEGGITRFSIHGLIGSSEEEREYAVRLLLEFCSDEACCRKIASEKGALVLLSSMAGNLEHPVLSNLADEVLKQMERVEDNVQPLTAAGRFEPLLSRLCEGMSSQVLFPWSIITYVMSNMLTDWTVLCDYHLFCVKSESSKQERGIS